MDDNKNWTTAINVNVSSVTAWSKLASFGPLIGVTIFISVSAFCLNAGLLVTHIIKPAYITQFTIYLLFLYISNTIYLAGASPFIFLSDVYSIDISSFGLASCMVFSYFHYVISWIPVMGHLLIALNRLWAVRFPHNYRVYHTKRVAWCICLGTALYVHVVKMPPFLLYKPLSYQTIPTPPHACTKLPFPVGFFYWARVDSFLNRFAPMFAIIVIYVYLLAKRLQNRKKKTVAPVDSLTNPPKSAMNETDGTGSIPRIPGRVSAGRQNVVRPFFILTVTTVSVITCWMPLATLFLCMWFLGPSAQSAMFTALQYCLLMYTLQMLFDPLMWIFSLKKGPYRRCTVPVLCK